MARWTEQGEKLIHDVANRYGASYEAISLMLDSILRGNGTMAQFNIFELGGCGQWMRGGMTMVGDMFNYQLKSKVDGICGDLSSAVLDQNLQVVLPPPTHKSGSDIAGPGSRNWSQWWPAEMGSPNASGSQNQYRYAYFAGMRRLAISDGQSVTVYDTLDHSIGGVSQQ
ncbi:MAG TPA: SHOCT domain-containing protein, partial [Pirellula sp.]|nr:SHOCT domain-containing protein [Pirellula sp.]